MNCVYCIYYEDKEDCYIGSTSNLKRRIREHKSRIKKNNKRRVYDFLRENTNWKFKILEENIDSENLYETEKLYIETIKPSLNYDLVEKEERKQRIKDYQKIFYQSKIQKEKKKKYREANKDKYKLLHKEYKEKMKGIKKICECGCEIEHSGLARHKKTKKHHQRMNQA